MKIINTKHFLNIKIFGILLSLSLSFSLNAQTWNLTTTATSSDASASSYFGSAVAMDGDYAVSRAVGAIYIFKRNQTTYVWTQQQKILISSSYNYGNGSVAISGNYIAVIGGSSITTGSLYVFKRDSTNDTWAQQKVLIPSDATGFSGAVSISGNYIVAGATSESEDANGTNTILNAGATYIYEQVSGIWSEQQKIVAASRAASATFGCSVSVSKNYLIISGVTSGADAAIFVLDTSTDIWSFQQTLTCSSLCNVVVSNGLILVNEYSYAYNSYTYTFNESHFYFNEECIYTLTYNYYYDYKCTNNIKIYKNNSSNNWTLQKTISQTSDVTTTSSTSSTIYEYSCDHYFSADPSPYPVIPTSGGRILNLNVSGNYLLTGAENSLYSLYKNNSSGDYSLLQSFSNSSKSSAIASFISGEDIAIGDNASNSNAGAVYFYKMSPYTTLLSTTASVGSTQNLTTSVNLIYNTPFTATSNQPWLSVNPSSVSPVVISDTIPLSFTASANSTTSARTAKITIAGTGVSNQYVIVTQLTDPFITWATPADITYGTALSSTQLNATANVEGTFTYTPSLGTVLNAGSTQTLRVDFIPKDAANYSSASKTVIINVKKVVPVITWTNPSDIIYGTNLSNTQLNATSNVVGTYAYNPIAGTKLNAGSGQTLSVLFTPIDIVNFELVSKTVQINVKKATPVITWTNPTDMYSGDVLSSTQLNATANVPGTFTYNPSVGTKLNVGNGQTLSTQLKTFDEINYELVSKQVSVNVIQAVLSVSTNTVNISFKGRETYTLTVNSNCPWVATSDQTWLRVSHSFGTGNGTIILSASENTNAFDRTAILTIKGAGETLQTITVTQTKVLQIIANITSKWDDVLVCNNNQNIFLNYQWYKNDESIPGETKQYYQELGGLNGSYYVKVTTSDETSGISNTIDISKTLKSIKVYPNPTQNNQNFSLEIKATESDLKQAELTILSVSGLVVFRDNNVQYQMQLNGLSHGCYIIHIRLTNGELLNEKLMVN